MAHAAMAARCPGFDFFFEKKLDFKFRQIVIVCLLQVLRVLVEAWALLPSSVVRLIP